ncbi:Ig-like domain-containing protein, partial [Okeania sp. SIO2B3]|uniref:Ig-like domain-containing protein n=1 Tax=Okeania sp. SIO2B3 TaxID=2607784 RepID=UPI0013C15B8D
PVTFPFLSNDTDPDGDIVLIDSFDLSSTNGGSVSLNNDGTFTYTPPTNFSGTDTFNYTVSDGNGGTDTATVSISVTAAAPTNSPPTAGADSATTTSNTSVTINVLANDSDPDEDDISLISADSTSANNGNITVNSDNTVTYTPADGFTGTDTFTYTIDDGNGGTDLGTVTVSVAPSENNPPVAGDDNVSTAENTPVTFPFSSNDTDPDGDTVLIDSFDSSSTNGGSVSLNLDGTFTYTPPTDFSGTDTFNYTVSDGNGGTDTATVTISVTAAAPDNSPPTAGADSATTTFNTAVTINVLANDSDPDEDNISVISADSTSANNGNITVNSDNTVTYTPADGFTGTDTFTYTIDDGNGGTDLGTVTVSVAPPDNNPPVAGDDNVSTAENTPVTFPFLSNDTDPDGDIVLIDSFDLSSTNGGSVSLNNDGTFTYTPPTNFSGTDTFNYTVSDGNGGTDTATVSISVTAAAPTNSPPTAGADSATTTSNTSVTINVLANDSDPDEDDISLTTVDSTSANNGNITVNSDNTVTYTPADGFTGTDTFTYTIDDGNGGTDLGTVTVSVNSLPPSFTFTNDLYSINENGTLAGDSIQVQRTGDTSNPETVQIQLTDGTATGATPPLDIGSDNQDFISNTLINVTFESGVASADVTVPINTINDDTVPEPTEELILNLVAVNEIIEGSPTTLLDSATLQIIDNDNVNTNISINDVTVNENEGTAEFTINLSPVSTQDVTVTYSTSDGTAIAGEDYTAVSDTITITAGQNNFPVTVPILNNDDNIDQQSETFNVNLSTPINAVISDSIGVGTIIEDNVQINPSFTVNNIGDVGDLNPGNGIVDTALGNGVVTLRAAIQEANALAGDNTINFDPNLSGQIILSNTDSEFDGNADLDITSNIIIDGLGANNLTISGGNISRVFDIQALIPPTVTINNLTIADGSVIGTEEGGGIRNIEGNVTLNNSTVRNNQGFNGGGISNTGGVVTVSNSTFANNSTNSTGSGGGISNNGGLLTVDSSTFSGNNSTGSGGGISSQGGANSGLIVNNSTISGNTSSVNGGGIYINAPASNNTLTSNTIVLNTASNGGGVFRGGGSTRINQSIILGNNNNNISNGLEGADTENLSNDLDTPIQSVLDTNLQNNGGPTETHDLIPGSLAIDAALGNTFNLDQRGIQRPIDGDGDGSAIADIGAVEASQVALPIVSITATDAVATEGGNDPGLFTVNIVDNPQNNPITVNYTINGTATNGIDYQPLTGQVVIDANQTSADINLLPILDQDSEPDPETVVLTLAAEPNNSYQIDPTANTAIVSINDTPPIVPGQGTIGGTKFNDINANGAFDPGEPGIQGVTIYLDLDNDGVFDPNEPSQITDNNGNYGFNNLPPNTYFVREVVPPGSIPTLTPGQLIVTTLGEDFTNINFGNTAAIVPGISITQTGGSTDVIEGLTTDTYQIELDSGPTDQVNITITSEGQALLSDNNNQIPSNTINLTFNPGNLGPQTITVTAADDNIAAGDSIDNIIHTATSNDQNYNGPTAPFTVDGTPSNFIAANIRDDEIPNVVITPTTTDATEGGATGSYQVFLTTQPIGDVAINFNTDQQIQPIDPITFDQTNWNVPRTVTVTAVDDNIPETETQNISTIAHQVFSQSDLSYNNLNISPVTVNIDDPEPTQVIITETDGNTTFTPGGSDNYTIQLNSNPTTPIEIAIAPPPEINLGSGPGVPITREFNESNGTTPQNVTVTGVNDGNFSISHSATLDGIDPNLQFIVDGVPTNIVNANVTSQPPPPLGNISGTVFDDLNNNGLPDTTEGIGGITVFIDSNNNNILEPNETNTVTDSNGNYNFSELEANTYNIRAVPQGNFIPELIAPVPLLAGQNATRNIQNNISPGRISGTVFDDLNNDGIPDLGETRFNNVTVTLSGVQNGIPIQQTTVTDPNGNYNFSNLPPNIEYTLTAVRSPDLPLQEFPSTVTIPAGESVSNINFAYDVSDPGTLQFSNPTFNVAENTPTATVTITRTDGSDGVVSANINLSSETAVQGVDFGNPFPNPIFFADGVTQQTVSIPIFDDSIIDGNKTVNL